jgi:hypothetical protein
MNRESFGRSIIAFALCGVAQACTSPGTMGADDDLAEPDNGGAQSTGEAARALGARPGDAAPGPVHKTPKVPLVIDGVRYAPEDIHLFDGRPLYMIVDLAEPDVLVGFTRQSDFRAATDEKKAALGSSPAPKLAGQYADYFSSDECRGDKLTINSGWGVNDLRAVGRACGIFGCAGDWNEVISSVWINGSQTLYPDIQYGGGWLWIGGWGCLNVSPYGYDNISSSLNVWF